jgi:alpha-maltose-1-phosphate synthase
VTVLLSALTRYHVFDLALHLNKQALVEGLVTAYPKFRLGRYAALSPVVISRPHFALGRKAAMVFERFAGSEFASTVHELIYSRWSSTFASIVQCSQANTIYGLSGYMLETLESDAGKSRQRIVDHGSLHIETERKILEDECARYGFAKFGNWQYDWLVRRMRQEFALADHVVCCSALARQTMIEHGVDANKIVVHRLGVNLKEFMRPPKRLRPTGCPLRLVFVGAMTPLKGLHYLLEAFRNLDADTELWLVGLLPTDPVLKAMIADCEHVTKRLNLIGPVAQSQLNAIYNQCDLFVLPSLSDGWGMVVSQAMACGLPVVVSDMTGAKELVSQGKNGYVVKKGDVADLTEKLALSIDQCRNGHWQESLDEVCTTAERTWSDYGNGWVQWLQNIDS